MSSLKSELCARPGKEAPQPSACPLPAVGKAGCAACARRHSCCEWSRYVPQVTHDARTRTFREGALMSQSSSTHATRTQAVNAERQAYSRHPPWWKATDAGAVRREGRPLQPGCLRTSRGRNSIKAVCDLFRIWTPELSPRDMPGPTGLTCTLSGRV